MIEVWCQGNRDRGRKGLGNRVGRGECMFYDHKRYLSSDERIKIIWNQDHTLNSGKTILLKRPNITNHASEEWEDYIHESVSV